MHGGLCAAQLFGHEDRVLQHVRAAHPERPVRRLHAQGRQINDAQGTRLARAAKGIRSEVSI